MNKKSYIFSNFHKATSSSIELLSKNDLDVFKQNLKYYIKCLHNKFRPQQIGGKYFYMKWPTVNGKSLGFIVLRHSVFLQSIRDNIISPGVDSGYHREISTIDFQFFTSQHLKCTGNTVNLQFSTILSFYTSLDSKEYHCRN